MRVEEQKASEVEKPAPDRARFQEALQQAGGQKASAAKPPPRPSGTAQGSAAPSSASRTSVGAAKSPATPPSSARAAVATKQVFAQARSALATPENLRTVRQGMNAEAQRLHGTRAEAHTVTQERTEHRATELIARELARDLRAEPSSPPAASRATSPQASESSGEPLSGEPAASVGPAQAGAASASAAPPEAPDAQLKAQAAMELIERIEVFVKSQRPALKMSLGGGLDATVEVERTGPREVALRIQGRRGPVPSGELARIRDALEAKGLRLRSLQAG